MTLEEAIKHAEEVAEQKECKMTSDDGYTDVNMKRCAEEHRQLAEWLKDYKRLLEQSCEDCISRQQAIDKMQELEDEDDEMYGCSIPEGFDGKRAIEALKALPSIQPKQKMGHWIIKEGREQGYDIAGIKTWYIQIMCDKCGFLKTAIEGHTGQYHFCPNCGAKMLPIDLQFGDQDTLMPAT